MIIHRDPRAAIGIDPLVGKIRLLAGPAADGDHPAFVGACNTVHLSPTELVITALAGPGITRAHLRLIASWAYSAGYRWIYAERLPGHTLPLAQRRSARPLSGWFEIDLERVVTQIPALRPAAELTQESPHA